MDTRLKLNEPTYKLHWNPLNDVKDENVVGIHFINFMQCPITTRFTSLVL
jgi:hypothetical protein